MPYVKRIVCLANSFKTGGSCIAGKEKLANGYGNWIRPISVRETAEISALECRYENHTDPKLLDIIDIPMLNTAPRQHQTENHVIDAIRRWVKIGILSWNELAQICDHPTSLWINGSSTKTGGLNNCISAERTVTLRNSLALIRPENFVVRIGLRDWDGKTSKTCWGSFSYNGVPYNLKLTDPVVANLYETKGEGEYPLGDVYICVSLTEPFKDGRCHKLVAAVFSERRLR